jgi:hypothetical protein
MLEIPADHLSATKDGESAKRFAQVKTNFSPRQSEAPAAPLGNCSN